MQLLLIVAGSLLPLSPLSRGWIELQDLLAYSALWLAMSVGATLIRLDTMERRTDERRCFALRYTIMIGILSLVCGVWAVILLAIAGVSGGWFALVPTRPRCCLRTPGRLPTAGSFVVDGGWPGCGRCCCPVTCGSCLVCFSNFGQ